MEQHVDANVSAVQMLSESRSGVLKLAAGFSDSLLSLKGETESLKKANTGLQDSSKPRGTALSVRHPHVILISAALHCTTASCLTALSCQATRLQ